MNLYEYHITNAGESMKGFSPVNSRGNSSSRLDVRGVVSVVHGVKCGLVAGDTKSIAKWLTYGAIVTWFPHERINGFCLGPTFKRIRKRNNINYVITKKIPQAGFVFIALYALPK